jgi:signal transduction histidine kinase
MILYIKKLPFLLSILLFWIVFVPISYSNNNPVIDSLLNELKYSTINNYRSITDNLRIQYNSLQEEDAEIYAMKAINIAEKLKYKNAICASYRNLAFVRFRDAKNFINKSNVELLILALEISKINKLKEEEILSNIDLAYIYLIKQNFKESLVHYREALKLSEKYKLNELTSITHSRLGSYYYHTGNFENSLYHLNKALENDFFTVPRYKINIINTIAVIYKKQMVLDSAFMKFSEVLTIAESSKDSAWIGITHGNLADIRYLKNECKDAIYLFEKDVTICTKWKEWENVAWALGKLGDCYACLNDYNKAKHYFDSALLLIQSKKIYKEYVGIYKSYIDLELSQKNYEKAYQLRNDWAFVQDSITISKNKKEIALLEVEFDTQKKESEVELLKKEKENHIMLKNTFIIAFFITALLSFFLYLNNRERKKMNSILIQQKEELSLKNEEIKQQQNEILEQNAKLQNINLSKDKLFSIVGHDLRSPISSLKGLLSIYELGGFTEADKKIIFSDLKNSLDDTGKMLDNVLDWAKTQMYKEEATPTMFNINSVIEDMYKIYSKIADNKSIILTLNLDENINVYADIDHYKIILRNLITNAIKFSFENGIIEIACYQDDLNVITVVKDNGVGMTSQEVSNLFSLDTHFTKHGTFNEKGTGLGLLLCKEYVNANNGNLKVESEKGVGSSFYVILRKQNFSKLN